MPSAFDVDIGIFHQYPEQYRGLKSWNNSLLQMSIVEKMPQA